MFNYAWPSPRLKENLSQMASEYIFLSTSVSNLERQTVWNTLKKSRALGLQKTGSVGYFRQEPITPVQVDIPDNFVVKWDPKMHRSHCLALLLKQTL